MFTELECVTLVPTELFLFAQDILLLKGEGEVKLNMAMGKGELSLRSYGASGQEVVRSQLQEVGDAWATLFVTAMSCHRYGRCSSVSWDQMSEPHLSQLM